MDAKIEDKFYNFLYRNLFAIIFLLIIITLWTLSLSGILPEPKEIFDVMKEFYDEFGIIILFISTLVEGFMFFGLYYMGTAFLLFAAIIAVGNIFQTISIGLVIWLALTIMSIVNFTLGRFTRMKDSRMSKVSKSQLRFPKVIIYFLHPTLLACLSYSLGSSKKSYIELVYVSLGVLIALAIYLILINAITLSVKALI